jgi:hypothetical protein
VNRAPATLPRAALIDAVQDGNAGSVVVARVVDPTKLLDGKSRRLHGDVIELLVDLAIVLLDEEDS